MTLAFAFALDDALCLYQNQHGDVNWGLVNESVRRKFNLTYARQKSRAYRELLSRVTPDIFQRLMLEEKDPRVALITLEKIYQRKSKISKMHKMGAFAALRQGSLEVHAWADLVRAKPLELRALGADPGELASLHQFIHHLSEPFHQTRAILMLKDSLDWNSALSALLDAEELLSKSAPLALLSSSSSSSASVAAAAAAPTNHHATSVSSASRPPPSKDHQLQQLW